MVSVEAGVSSRIEAVMPQNPLYKGSSFTEIAFKDVRGSIGFKVNTI